MALAFTLPKKYLTSTLILVESQRVPDSIVRTSSAREQPGLRTTQQEILSRTRLEKVIAELNPYPEKTGKVPLTEVIEAMRSAVTVSVRGSDALTIEFVHSDPRMAQSVTNRLASLFIEETSRARTDQVTGAASFIDAQLTEARQALEEKEKELRRYKEANMGRLPEQTQANLATLQRFQLEQQSLSSSLQSARQRLVLLEEGRSDLVPSERGGLQVSDPSRELGDLRNQLVALRQRYTDEHPDVRALVARISALERQMASAARAADGSAAAPPSNPRAEQAQIEVASLVARLAEVEGRIQSFQQRVEQAPRTEQEMANLTRDYAQLNQNYLTLFNKMLEVQMAESRERRWKGEQFRVLDPAYLPEKPYFPNKTLFLAVGLALGLVTGLAIAFGAEFLDSSVKGVRDLGAFAPLPLLALVPRIGTRRPPDAGRWQVLRWRLDRARPAATEELSLSGGRHVLSPRGPAGSGDSPPVFEEARSVQARPASPVCASILGRSYAAEEFRSLAARLRRPGPERPLRSIGIVSAVAGEGKSTTALGLAAALAGKSERVLLVDADLRRPAVDHELGLPARAGLSDWLRLGLEQVPLRRVVPPGFTLLSAGKALETQADRVFAAPQEMDRLRALMVGAKAVYDYVVVDCPPLLPVADSILLQEHLDGILVVIRERYAPAESIAQALDRLDEARLVGIVLNDHSEVLSRYRKYHVGYYGRNP